MTISVYEGLTGNREVGNTPCGAWPISGDWDELGIPNLVRMSLIKSY